MTQTQAHNFRIAACVMRSVADCIGTYRLSVREATALMQRAMHRIAQPVEMTGDILYAIRDFGTLPVTAPEFALLLRHAAADFDSSANKPPSPNGDTTRRH
jgi:hypothetical protein